MEESVQHQVNMSSEDLLLVLPYIGNAKHMDSTAMWEDAWTSPLLMCSLERIVQSVIFCKM